jgi:hypothetical protein
MSNNGDNLIQPQQDGAERTHASRRTWHLLGLAAGLFLLLGVIGGEAARIILPSALLALVAIVTGIGFIAVSVAMVGLSARLPLPWKVRLELAVVFGLGSAAAKVGAVRLSENMFLELIGDLCLFIAATFFGVLASRIIKERNIVVPVAAAAAAVDTFGVYWGPVAEIARRAPHLAKQLSAAVPGSNIPEAPIPQLGYIGVGDFLFMGLFVAAVYRLGMNARGTLRALFLAFLAVPVVFALTNLPALPGLVFLGLAVVAANRRYFSFSRAEKFALAYAAVVVAVLIALAWGIKHMLRG